VPFCQSHAVTNLLNGATDAPGVCEEFMLCRFRPKSAQPTRFEIFCLKGKALNVLYVRHVRLAAVCDVVVV